MAISTLTKPDAVSALKNPGNLQDNMFVRARDLNSVIDVVNTVSTQLNSNNATEVAATGTGNTPTVNALVGKVTTASLTTAALATTNITVTNNKVVATSIVTVQVEAYSGTIVTNGIPLVFKVTPGAGSFVVTIFNSHGTNALQGTVKFSFTVNP